MSTTPDTPFKHAKLTQQVLNTIETPDPYTDPVARQYIFTPEEHRIKQYELADPIGDDAHSPVKGIVHRYPDRVLLKITDTCAVYCRFCFRKETVGGGVGTLRDEEVQAALDYVRSHTEIREIILTGGDPLTLSNRRLGDLLTKIESIGHVELIRIHTRAPLVNPARVDDGLLTLFKDMEKALYVVLHVNHANEINEAIRKAVRQLSQTGAVLLSQSVLLKGVNDNPETLETLFRTLLANRIKPYYLHHPDLAPGTSHFYVDINRGQDIIKSLRGRVTGLAYPHYVLDLPGGFGKMPLTPCAVTGSEGTLYEIEDYKGKKHRYPPSPAKEVK